MAGVRLEGAALQRPGEDLTLAITRYRNYIQRKGLAVMNNQPNAVPTDLPLDIAWIWCVHTLNPSSYRDDCMRAFRKVVPFHEDTTQRKKKNIMPAFHDTSYNTPLSSSSFSSSITSTTSSSGAISPMPSFQPSIDLNPAVMRQLSFLNRSEIFSTAKPIMYLRLRLQYARFLLLMREYGQKHTLVPTLGIDLMWHAHMTTPECYEADCQRIVGRFVNHDDSIDEKSLAASLEVTSQLWNKHHKSEYIKARPSLARSQNNNAKKNDTNAAVTYSSGCGGVAACGYVPVHATTPVCGSACGAKHHHHHHHDGDVAVDGVSPTSSPPASELLNCGGGTCTGEFTPLTDAAGGGGGDAASAAASCGGASTCGGGGCGGASSCGGGCGGGCSS
eukprot:TRINITY_DN4389_c0_g1_i2.p1 TRINITY_DN4389_c0_g1~~TRINITY_DN4389_c0_g1_i2.p1  ORF type:complete len:414 (-),score=101.43 TRINITY_DN4389_c0_g1_i2:62-1228(-)